MLKLEPLPMEEARQFWANKVKLGPGEFAKLSKEAKIKAFAVSGIAKGDELDTVFAALQKAIDQGVTLEEFKKDCAAIFERRGWRGKRTWRIDNIFRTNIQTAYNVGQYKQLMEDREVFPVWQYSAINDSRTRPTHLAMDGRAWPANHPMWDVWFPPNGYRCRCSVIGLTARQAAQRGVTVETVDPTNTLIEPIDPLTGNRMPARQLLPDPGFNVNPGKVVYPTSGDFKASEDGLLEKLKAWKAPATASLFPGVADKRLRKLLQEAFDGKQDLALALAEKYGQVTVTKARSKGSSYMEGTIRLGGGARKGSRLGEVFRHEFGHHVDYSAGKNSAGAGMSRWRTFRSEQDDFAAAFRADGDALLDGGKRQAELQALVAEHTGRYFDHPPISDLIGAVTLNRIHGRWGHFGNYYAQRGFGGRVKQAFANLFDLYAVGGDDWEFVKKELPRVAAVFETIMEELAAK